MSDSTTDREIKRWLTRRNVLQAGTVGGAALLAGCAGGGDDGNGSDGSDESNSDTTAFIEGMGANTSTLDPHGEPRVPNSIVHSSIYDTLFVVDSDLEVQPHLVSEYTVNDDATQFNFSLRDDVTFHDGNELNAEAVVWTFERMLPHLIRSRHGT